MKVGIRLGLLAIITASSLFAQSVSDINLLVEKINNTKDVETKTELMKKLNTGLDSLDKKDLPVALEIVNTKLKK